MEKRNEEQIESIILEDEDGEVIEITPKQMFRMFKFVAELMDRKGL